MSACLATEFITGVRLMESIVTHSQGLQVLSHSALQGPGLISCQWAAELHNTVEGLWGRIFVSAQMSSKR